MLQLNNMGSTRKRISVYVSDRKHRELKTACAQKGVSMSRYVDEAIEQRADRERRKIKELS